MENKMKNKAKSKRRLMNEETFKRLIATLIVAVLLISVVGYFVYFTGLPSRVLTGVEIVQTAPDGTVEVVYRAKVAELNYYFSAVYNQYSQVGLISDKTDLDAPQFEGVDYTYRDILYDRAAENIAMAYLTYQAAMQMEGFEPQVTDAILQDTIDLLRENAAMYGITVDDFLQNIYGRGMTLRTYTSIVRREIIVEEFREYLRQDVFYPSMEEVEDVFALDTSNYAVATFNYFYFRVPQDENMSEEDLAAAILAEEVKAVEVSRRAIHSQAFRQAVIEVGGPDVEALFADGRDPTLAEDYTKALAERLHPQIAEYVFDPQRQTGDTTVLVSDEGVFVVYFGTIGFDETPTVSYRILQINDPDAFTVDEDVRVQNAAQLVARAQTIIDGVQTESDFIRMVYDYSEDIQKIYSAGLVSGQVKSQYTNQENLNPDYDLEFSEWLFSDDRQWGDMYIQETPSGVNIIYFRDNLPAYLSSARENIILERRATWEETIMPEDTYDQVIIRRNVDFAQY